MVRVRGVRAAAVLGAMVLLATACSGGKEGDGAGGTVAGKEDVAAPQVTITPADGSTKAKPEKGVSIKVGNGTLQSVAVTVRGKPVYGQMSADKATWQSRTLIPNAAYKVAAVATNPQGKTTNAAAAFKTHKAPNALSVIDITPAANEKVGVGMPIMVVFNRSVTDKKAVERALVVRSTQPAVGAWYWVSSQKVIFRTRNGTWWKANQKVALTARLAGVKAGKDVYGTTDVTRKFRIGDQHVTTVSTKSHKMVVKVNGKTVKKTGISAGKGGRVRNGIDTYETTSGIHLTMSKHLVEKMTSEWMGVDPKDTKNGGYELDLPHAVRISDTGEYAHASPDRYWAFGRTNASHGCVNLPPPVAKWFYELAYRGDPFVITGSNRSLPWNNGWSFYEMSWKQWVKGSALNRSVTTG